MDIQYGDPTTAALNGSQQSVEGAYKNALNVLQQEDKDMRPGMEKFKSAAAAPIPTPPEPKKASPAPDAGQFAKDSQGWVVALSALSALIGSRGRARGTGALKAFAGGMQGIKQGNQQAFDDASKTWKENTEAMQKENAEELAKYDAILKNRELSESEAMQEIKLVAAEHQNATMLAMDNYHQAAALRDSIFKAQTELAMYDKKLQMQKELWDEKNKPSMTPEAIKMTADQLGAGDYSALTNVGRGTQGAANIAAIKNELASRGFTGEQLAQIDLQYKAKQSEERTLGTQTAKMRTAGVEFDQLADQALAASAKVDRGKYPTLNSVLLAAERGTGDENVVRFAAAANGAVNTYARAINPSGIPRVADQEKGLKLLDTAFSKGQFAAAIDQMKKETIAASQSPGIVQQEMTGTKSATPAPVNLIDKYGLEP